MPDESVSAQNAAGVEVEFERSRLSAARLLNSMSEKLGRSVVSKAADRVRRAAKEVQAHSMKDVATGIERVVRQRPVASIAVAVVAGFLVGRALRSR